jgi:type I restriction enzyme M protein
MPLLTQNRPFYGEMKGAKWRKNCMAKSKSDKNNGATLGLEQTLWLAADKLRKNIDAAEYKTFIIF